MTEKMETIEVFNQTLNLSGLFNTTQDLSREPYGDDVKLGLHILGIVIIILAPVIIAINLTIIVTILTNFRLRKEFRYLVIASMSLAEVLIGMISCPIRGDVMLTMSFGKHACFVYIFVSVIEEFVQMFVGIWGIVAINVHYLLNLFNVRLPKLSARKEKLIVATIVALPWLAMFFLVLPVAYAFSYGNRDPFKYCYAHLHSAAKGIVFLFVYLIPGFIIICQTGVIIVRHMYRRQCNRGLSSSTDTASPWVFVSAGMVNVLLISIEQFYFLIRAFAPPSTFLVLFILGVFLSDLKSVVVPSIWFALPEVRSAFWEFINRLPWRRADNVGENTYNTVIAYKNMPNDPV